MIIGFSKFKEAMYELRIINNLIIPVNSLSAYVVQIRLLTVNFDKRRNFSLQQGSFL